MRSPGTRGRPAGGALLLTLVLGALLAVVPATASAATVTSAWRAKVGSAGANGTATIQGYSTGNGSIVLKFARLKPASSLPVTIHTGTCSSVGAVLFKLPAIKTTSAGAAARTSALTAGQVNLVKSATRDTGKVSLRVGSGSAAKCGVFTGLAVPPAVTATIPVGYYPVDVAVTPGAAFAANALSASVSKIDPATNSVLSSFQLGEPGTAVPWAVATDEGALWVSVVALDQSQKILPGNVVRLDPATGQVVATIPVGRAGYDIATSPGAVWVPNFDDGTVSRIDTATNTVASTITLAPGVEGVAWAEGSVWVTNERTGAVSRIDAATNTVTATIATVGLAEGIVGGAGSIWVVNFGTTGQADGVLSRIDPATNQVVRTIPLGTNPVWVSYAGGSVWVSMYGEPTVVQVSAQTNAVVSRVPVGASSQGIAATDHDVWVTHPIAAGGDPESLTPGTVTRLTY